MAWNLSRHRSPQCAILFWRVHHFDSWEKLKLQQSNFNPTCSWYLKSRFICKSQTLHNAHMWGNRLAVFTHAIPYRPMPAESLTERMPVETLESAEPKAFFMYRWHRLLTNDQSGPEKSRGVPGLSWSVMDSRSHQKNQKALNILMQQRQLYRTSRWLLGTHESH